MNTKNTGLVAIALIVILGVGVFLFSNKSKPEMKQIITPTESKKEVSAATPSYKDGEYTQAGDYTSPGGAEQIDVDLTLKNDIIVDAKVTSKAEKPKSKFMQGVFVENYKQYVIGKNINDLKLSKVAGSSLTPQGFNDAVEKIKAQAKS